MALEIPVGSSGAQKFVTDLGGTQYELFVQFNDRSGVWTMDIKEYVSGKVIVIAAPLLIEQDILNPYNLNIGSIVAVDTSGAKQEATVSDLGTRVKVFWVAEGEAV